MSDKAETPNSTAEQGRLPEAIIKDGASHGKTDNALADFVAELLPRMNSNKDKINSMSQEQFNKLIDSKLPEHMKELSFVEPHEKGVIKLKSGDTLIRAGGLEVLALNDGGTVIINPDGSYEANSETPAKVKFDAKTGTTTLQFGETSVEIRDGKIYQVGRDGRYTRMQQHTFNPKIESQIDPDLWMPRYKPTPNLQIDSQHKRNESDHERDVTPSSSKLRQK